MGEQKGEVNMKKNNLKTSVEKPRNTVPSDFKSKINACNPDIRQYVVALKVENLKLQKQIIKYQAREVTLKSRITALEERFEEDQKRPKAQVIIKGLYDSHETRPEKLRRRENEMPTHKDNFNLWFREIIESLYKNEDAGFPLLMLTFPLLERYLRKKSNTSESSSVGDPFYDELLNFFPILNNRVNAKKFWQVYRNGILHQATLSQRDRKGINMPDGWLSGDEKEDVHIDSSGAFWVNPVYFASHVINAIDKDFLNFEARSNSDHRLATVITATDGSHSTSGPGRPPSL